jgi:predicted MPP superfamily phosphohydrolase
MIIQAFSVAEKICKSGRTGLAAIPFMSLIYGITIGVQLTAYLFPDLPDAFDGFTITQISDVHSGSFDNPKRLIMRSIW